jgi:hypothetical protein
VSVSPDSLPPVALGIPCAHCRVALVAPTVARPLSGLLPFRALVGALLCRLALLSSILVSPGSALSVPIPIFRSAADWRKFGQNLSDRTNFGQKSDKILSRSDKYPTNIGQISDKYLSNWTYIRQNSPMGQISDIIRN